jgi:4-amino-4-deoxy-L-arabinose transferase-like glycosyltransferase
VKKLLDWAFCVWLVAITARYAATTWKALHNPFNPGDDATWFNGWIVACVLGFLASRFLPPQKFWRGLLAICAAGAALIFTLSQVWLGLIVAASLLAACFAIGAAMLGSMRIAVQGVGELVSLAVPVGMALLSVLLFALGLTGHFSVLPIAALFAVAILFLLRQKLPPRSTTAISTETVLPAALIAFSALLNLLWAVAPEVQFDALNYHLAMPQAYLNAGAIVDIRFLHAYLSKFVELFFGAGLALAGVPAVKLFVYGLGLCAATATYSIGKVLFSPRVGMWAAAFFYTAPIVGWLTGTAYIDNIVAFLCAAVLLVFVKWYQSRDANLFLVASIIAGVAVGTKVNAGFVFVLVLPVMAFAMRRELAWVMAGACAFLGIALPTYLLTWKFTGNPVFPLLNGIFKSPVWPAENTIFNAASFGLPKTLANLGVFPFRLTLDSVRFGEATPRGALGMSLLVAAFAVIFLPRLGRAAGVLVAVAAVYLVLLFYTMQYARYFVAILPVVAVLAAATSFAGDVVKSRSRLWIVEGCLFVGIVAQFPALSSQYWMLPERFPSRLAFGLEDREAFTRRALPGYEAAQHLNSTSKDGDRIIGVDVEYLRFYLKTPLVAPPLSLLDDPVRRLSTMPPDASLAAAIGDAGFTHLLVSAAQLRRSPPDYPYLDKAFLASYATAEYSGKDASVFRFRR